MHVFLSMEFYQNKKEAKKEELKFYREIHPSLMQWATYKYNLSEDTLLDLCQSTYEKLIKSNLKLSEIKTLLAICKHNFRQVALDYFRKNKREPQNEAVGGIEETLFLKSDSDIEGEIENSQKGVLINKCWKKIDKKYQGPFLEFIHKSMTLSEISKEYNCTYYKVQMLSKQLPKEFRRCFEREGK